jgi:hypothetical protein
MKVREGSVTRAAMMENRLSLMTPLPIAPFSCDDYTFENEHVHRLCGLVRNACTVNDANSGFTAAKVRSILPITQARFGAAHCP